MQTTTTQPLSPSARVPMLFGNLTPKQQTNWQASGWKPQGAGPITPQTEGLIFFGNLTSKQQAIIRQQFEHQVMQAAPLASHLASSVILPYGSDVKLVYSHDEENDVDVTVVYGHGHDVTTFLNAQNPHTGKMNLQNKEAIAQVLLDDGRRYLGTGGQWYSWLAVAFVDGYHENFKKTKKQIAKHLATIAERMSAKSMSGTVKVFSVLHAFSNGAFYANANVGIKKTPSVVNTLNTLWGTVFTNGYVAGAKNKTRTIALSAQDSARIGLYGRSGNVEFVQSAFADQQTVRLAVFDDVLVECLPSKQAFKGITVEGIENAQQIGTAPTYQDVQISGLNNGKVTEFSKAIGNAVIATLDGGENAFIPLAASTMGGKIILSPIDELAVQRTAETTAMGQIESADRDAIVSRLREGKLLTFKSTPTAQTPETVGKMVQGLYSRKTPHQPQQAAA